MRTKTIWTALAIFAAATAAAIDNGLIYHGRLRKTSGGTSDLPTHLRFTIYAEKTGGSALWARDVPIVCDTDGEFGVYLTDDTGEKVDDVNGSLAAAITAGRANGGKLYVNIKVSDKDEQDTRQLIAAAPLAAYAATATAALGDFSVTSNVLVNGSMKLNSDLAVLGPVTATNSNNTFEGYGMVPIGGIVAWSGDLSNIPAGWKLCDGADGTPDLRGSFVVGYSESDPDYNELNKTGGVDKVTLTDAGQMPAHTHTYLKPLWGGTRSIEKSLTGNKKHVYANGIHERNDTGKTGGEAHENRPPYFVIAFIMRVR